MSTDTDRRAPGAPRIQFDAMVEVGGTLGPSFEAQAVNLSEEGMHLRTAYLPEIGQPVTCRFDTGQGVVVVAQGEVLWNEEMGDGGEFGIRFTNLDSPSTLALQRILGTVEEGAAPPDPLGRKVRLHIEGLGSPMRARVKGDHGTSVTAFSELGFLQVGKHLDLEDATSGARRPALIDRVAVEVEKNSRIPQLVVTLRYDDEQARHEDAMNIDVDDHAMREEREPHRAPAASVAVKSDIDADDEESKQLKSAFSRTAAKVTPALNQWAKRAKTTIALLAARANAKRGAAGHDAEIPVRRTTAPAPSGGLHASGRKVVRGEIEEKVDAIEAKPAFKITKKKMVAAGAIGAATILAFVALGRPAKDPVAASAPPAASSAALAAALPAPVAAPMPVPQPAPLSFPTPANDPLASRAAAAAGGGDMASPDGRPHRTGKVVPFGNGPVVHGNAMRIKMDGPIEVIQGASQPTGFTVVIPGRKSLEAAGPLAAKDSRIAAIRMSNEAAGAELSVTFKDGVPNYIVRAKGDTLEMTLARPGHAGDKAPEAHAKKKKKNH